MGEPYRLRGEDCSRYFKRYQDGESMTALGKELGVTRDAVRKWFVRNGYTTDYQATAGRLRGVDLGPLYTRYLAGEPIDDLAAEAGVHAGGLRAAWRREGRTVFARGRHPNSRRYDALPPRPAWTVAPKHRHILAEGVCLLCDERVA